MPITPKWDRVFQILSWILVVALLYGVFAVWFSPPGGSSPFIQVFGIIGSKIFYSFLYGGEALVLAGSKFFKKKNLRKHALMAIYLTGFFTSILIITITGVHVGLIDNLLLAALASVCWLYWKFKIEYIDPVVFQKEIESLRRDLPPKT